MAVAIRISLGVCNNKSLAKEVRIATTNVRTGLAMTGETMDEASIIPARKDIDLSIPDSYFPPIDSFGRGSKT